MITHSLPATLTLFLSLVLVIFSRNIKPDQEVYQKEVCLLDHADEPSKPP